MAAVCRLQNALLLLALFGLLTWCLCLSGLLNWNVLEYMFYQLCKVFGFPGLLFYRICTEDILIDSSACCSGTWNAEDGYYWCCASAESYGHSQHHEVWFSGCPACRSHDPCPWAAFCPWSAWRWCKVHILPSLTPVVFCVIERSSRKQLPLWSCQAKQFAAIIQHCRLISICVLRCWDM